MESWTDVEMLNILSLQENASQTTLRLYVTPVRMDIKKKPKKQKQTGKQQQQQKNKWQLVLARRKSFVIGMNANFYSHYENKYEVS